MTSTKRKVKEDRKTDRQIDDRHSEVYAFLLGWDKGSSHTSIIKHGVLF